MAISLKDARPPESGRLTRAGKREAAFYFLKGPVEVEGRDRAEGTWQGPAGLSRANGRNYHTGCWARGFQEGWGGKGGWALWGPAVGCWNSGGISPSWVGLVQRVKEPGTHWLPPQLDMGRRVWAGTSQTGLGDTGTLGRSLSHAL